MDISEKSDREIETYVRRMLKNNSAVSISGSFPDYSTEHLHKHPFHQILMIHDGMSLLIDQISSQALFGRQCAIIPAGVLHRSVTIGGNITYQSLYIRSEIFKQKETSVTIFPISSLGYECFKRIGLSRKMAPDKNTEYGIFQLFIKILSEDSLKRNKSITLPVPQSVFGKKASEYIEINYGEKITLDDFKNISPLSTRQFSRLFKDDCGITIFSYLRGYRLMMASLKLSRGETILESAYSCGYQSISSFFADFKRYYGISPSRFFKKTFPHQ
jgi:AraC-like DNA-binding protein